VKAQAQHANTTNHQKVFNKIENGRSTTAFHSPYRKLITASPGQYEKADSLIVHEVPK
jgi:hypothetical protein